MFRIPVSIKITIQKAWVRSTCSSSFIRNTFIEYFVKNHGHKFVKSSSVVPLHDASVPFVNAGMNQFKSVFLGKVDPPCPKAVNSQKCIRVGGKHNDLDMVGTDGHHHTFFEMLGNWSFGDYYKKEACQMAWDLLLGPYRLKPENLIVTYFQGDIIMGLIEDRECRDIWKKIGVPASRLQARFAKENFWEMGSTGPCGPCTEIHYVNPDGTLTEIWNLVFIQLNREMTGKVVPLEKNYVDTGMGLERMAAILQGVPSNYETDLFEPLIRAIEENSVAVAPYGGRYGDAPLDAAYRQLSDHARMVSVCLADGVFPATSLNLKQILRKAFRLSTDVFHNPNLLPILYEQVVLTLGDTYPELTVREKDIKTILEHEAAAYARMRAGLAEKWKDLVQQYPEVEDFSDMEMGGFAMGYKEFKETMTKLGAQIKVIPADLVFKLYDTHGFQENVIQRIAMLNNLEIDRTGFWKLLEEHKARHKTALQEQSANKGVLFNKCIERLNKNGIKSTNDQPKYEYSVKDNEINLKPLSSTIVAILNTELEWIDYLQPSEKRTYYLVTKDTNFYCEEGGQIGDTGVIKIHNGLSFEVDSVFKIRDIIFHKGRFDCEPYCENCLSNDNVSVSLEVDNDKRLNVMRNHTAVHLLNAAIRKVLRNSVVCQIGSSVTDKGLSLNLSIYGDKLSQNVIMEAQNLVRKSIESNVPIETRIIDAVKLTSELSVLMVPGETYPESGLRMVAASGPLQSKELCCGTHVPSTGLIKEFCVTAVKGAGGHSPAIHAITGDAAKEAREQFCRAQKLEQVIDLINPIRKEQEITNIRNKLHALCAARGAPFGEHAACLALLHTLQKHERNKNTDDVALQAIAEEEIKEAITEASDQGRRFVVHFVRCSYLMNSEEVWRALSANPPPLPALVLGCAGGTILASCYVPEKMVTKFFTAERWLSCILPIFNAQLMPPKDDVSPTNFAQMSGTKVSLINCEQLVQDAMRVAIKFAQAHNESIATGCKQD